MALYEITTTRAGCSYGRAYAWAHHEEHARALFACRNPGQTVTQVTRLFGAEDKPFCTDWSDEGFEA